MTQEKSEQRYFPTQEELSILVPRLKEYFLLPERSNERKAVVSQTFDAVKDLNPTHWNQSKIRLWFNNNKSVYSGDNQRRIPSPMITSETTSDSNTINKIKEESSVPPMPTDMPSSSDLQIINPPSTIQPTPTINPSSIINPSNINTQPVLSSIGQTSNLVYPTDSMQFEKYSLDPYSLNGTSPSNSFSMVQPILSPFDSKFSITNSPSNSMNLGLPFALPSDIITSYNSTSDSYQSQQEQKVSVDLPEIPAINENLDQNKYNLYESLNQMYTAIHQISELNPNERLDIQKKAEERMTQILKSFHDTQILDICSNDKKCQCIKTSASKLGRQYSTTTSSYAGETLAPRTEIKYEQISPNVFIPLSSKNRFKVKGDITQNLSYIMLGECTVENIKPLDAIQCAAISGSGEIAYVYLNGVRHAHFLRYKGMEVPTGFFTASSSIFIDDINSTIYVAGDCRIKSFSATDLSLIETFQASSTSAISSSCITVSIGSDRTDLIFGTKGVIAMWDVSAPKPLNTPSFKNSQNQKLSSQQDLDPNLIEWSRGRPPEATYKPEKCIEEVTSLCSFNDIIAFASKKHHSIHLLDKNRKEIVGRLIGHVKGITCLLRLDAKTLLSGSKDLTCKRWDIDQMFASFQFIRHNAKVTSLASGFYENHNFIFSGGKDSLVLGWDLTKKLSTFEIRLNGAVPIEMKFLPHSKKLIVVTTNDIMIYIFKSE